uniref:Putative methyltransferase-like protein 9 n=1 Tax=Tabanus bromius TaxID=304241 RepID=A0A0K8TKH8_TABBR
MASYRPRGALARAIFEKVHNDQYLDEYDTRLWYTLNKPLSERFQSKFISFERPDDITLNWLEKAKSVSANIWLQIWHTVARVFLGLFMTQTDVNGLLNRGSMFILSEIQFKDLLAASGFDLSHFSKNSTIDMLDIGAGDGEITIRLANSLLYMKDDAPLRVYATETSWTMRSRLQKKQFIVLDDISEVSNIPLVSCLNVLDRCIDPHQIMQDIYDVLAPNGRVIVALVLPYVHYVEYNSSHLPLSPLLPHWPKKARQYPFEIEAAMFFEMLENIGFRLEAWTKAPYLCEGDLRQSFYWLVDVVVVLSKKVRL